MKKSFLFLLLSCSFLNAATPIKNISEIAAGGYFILLLTQNKNVLALGDNKYGELGNGESWLGLVEENPVTVVGPSKIGYLTNIKAIACGDIHSLALHNNGNVYSWGDNEYGQLGNDQGGEGVKSNFPVQVVGEGGVGYLTNIKAIACGDIHSLALHNNGNVYSWGDNLSGQLGDNTYTGSNFPVKVVGEEGLNHLTNIKAIAGGGYYSLALHNNGNVYSWGDNEYGQLGNDQGGEGIKSSFPVQVVGEGGLNHLTNIKAISAGWAHSLALDNDGNVYSWGDNEYGQLGNDQGGEGIMSSSPVQVVGVGGLNHLTNIKAISAGWAHSLALDNDGNVYSWGDGSWGKLGVVPEIQESRTPILIESLDSIIAISANNGYSLALKNDGTVWFWGELNHFTDDGSKFFMVSFVPIQLTEEIMRYLPKGFFGSKVFY